MVARSAQALGTFQGKVQVKIAKLQLNPFLDKLDDLTWKLDIYFTFHIYYISQGTVVPIEIGVDKKLKAENHPNGAEHVAALAQNSIKMFWQI